MMPKTQKTIHTSSKIYLLIACFFWAASFIATKIAVAAVPPLTMVTLRLIISALCFLVWMLITGKKIRLFPDRSYLFMIILSLFGTGLHYSIQTIGIHYTTPTNASVYAVTGPITIVLISAIFLKEKITLKKVLGIGSAILGVLMIMGLNLLKEFRFSQQIWGDMLVLGSIFMWGIFTVMSKGRRLKMDALELTAAITFIGTLIMIPAGILESHSKSFNILDINLTTWGAIAFLGITCSFMATLFYIMALEKTESQKVGVYLYTIPPMTAVLSVLFFNETLGIHLLLGALLVLLGVYLTEKG